MPYLTALQWTLILASSIGIGLSKTGIPGLGIVAVGLFALALPSKLSTGIVLPLLIVGDIVAVAIYRRTAVWSHVLRLFPWTVVGIVIGYLALGNIDDHFVGHLIGGILIILSLLQLVRRYLKRDSDQTEGAFRPHSVVFIERCIVFSTGVLAGFTTMVANAAGPVMIIYLLAMRLPKLEFIGTSAWFFFLLNLFKVPFSISLGLINQHNAFMELALAPFVIVGGLIGRWITPKINQIFFENVAIALTIIAGAKLAWHT